MVDGYYGNVGGYYRSTAGSGTSGTTTGRSVPTPYAPITRYTNTQTQMTVISISSLGSNNSYRMPYDRSKTNTDDGGQEYEYIIADPRQIANYSARDLTPYWRGTYNNGQAVNWTDTQAGKIQIGNTTVPNYIAPKLLVASRWSRTENWGDQTTVNTYQQDYQTATKRCATYQEAGYPAGRWRLPTDAEIIFMAYLQRYQFIDELYSDGAHNVSASGSLIRVRNAQNNREIQYWSSGIAQGGTSQKVSSMRCVYDLWYWGEEPVSGASSTYTIAVE